jgi:hypothetical protein
MEETKCECGANVSCECGPKESPKQDTVEEAEKEFEKLINGKSLPTKQLLEVAEHYFIVGYRISQEKSYSEEQIRKTLINLKLVDPLHLQMTSNGHGEFPDGYKLTDKGVQYIIDKLRKNENN